MNQTELIERLTDIVKQQADIIKKQSELLAQYGAIDLCEKEIEVIL